MSKLRSLSISIEDFYTRNDALSFSYSGFRVLSCSLGSLHFIVKIKVVPGISELSSTYMVPLKDSTIYLHMFKPIPIPDVLM